MNGDNLLNRRSVLLGAAGTAAAGLIGAPAIADATTKAATSAAARPNGQSPLWRKAWQNGIVFGSSTATWQISDKQYAQVFDREAAMLFTEDDLLWYQLKPTPESRLRFGPGDEIVSFARRNDQLVFAAHLVWDEGFGEGWTDDDLWGLSAREARRLLYPLIRREVSHYRGKVAAWIVANEVIDPEGRNGFRTNVPWWNTIGRSYISDCFFIAQEEDPNATLVLNEFGFETTNQYGDKETDRQRAALQVIDQLLGNGVPVQAFGIQGHLLADHFHARFHEARYRKFLREVADRGLKIFITEMDVLDDGIRADPKVRDRKIADIYRHYLDVALDEQAVKALICFGLSDRYTWLQEDYPREDGAARRPLLYNQHMHRKPAYWAVAHSLAHAPKRRPMWRIPRAGGGG